MTSKSNKKIIIKRENDAKVGKNKTMKETENNKTKKKKIEIKKGVEGRRRYEMIIMTKKKYNQNILCVFVYNIN